MSPSESTFKENYDVLKSIADKLQNSSDDPDIDTLVTDVEKATNAYKNCKARLDSVNNALAKYLQQNTSTETSNITSSLDNKANDDFNEDIPF